MKHKSAAKTAGFTLVELIVVIVIMGVLSGVGVAAYNGYVTNANKGVDRQTVGELIKAITFGDAANPNLFGESGAAVVALTKDGVKIAGNAALGQAIADSYGSLETAKLQYEKWSGTVDPAVLTKATTYLQGYSELNQALEKGTGAASYGNNIAGLWGDVEDYADYYYRTFGQGDNDYNSPGSFVAAAAALAAEKGAETVNAWSKGISMNVAGGGSRWLALSMARNYSFAEYLQNNYSVSPETIKTLQSISGASGDFFMHIKENRNPGLSDVDFNVAKEAASKYLAADENNVSQALLDAQGFVAIMQTVNDVSGNKDSGDKEYQYNFDDPDYLSAMGNYAGTVGAVLSGSVKVGDIANTLTPGESSIVLNVSKSGGKLLVRVSPDDADPRDNTAAPPSDSEEDNAQTQETHMLEIKIVAGMNSVRLSGDGISVNSGDKVIILVPDGKSGEYTATYTRGKGNAQERTVYTGDYSFSVNGQTIAEGQAFTVTETTTVHGSITSKSDKEGSKKITGNFEWKISVNPS